MFPFGYQTGVRPVPGRGRGMSQETIQGHSPSPSAPKPVSSDASLDHSMHGPQAMQGSWRACPRPRAPARAPAPARAHARKL